MYIIAVLFYKDCSENYRTHTNSAPGYYFHARHLGGLVIEFSARDLLLEKVFYFDGKKLSLGVLYYL